jgi:peptidoglycan/LPS O-acetylase OafA/YrhL
MFMLMKLSGLDYAHVFPLSAAVTILVGWLSFKFYEKPIINWGHRVSLSFHKTGEASHSAPKK